MITTDYNLKSLFFDRPRVRRSIDDGRRRALSKIGAFVRRRARSQLRIRKRVSSPGESPSIHSRDKIATLKNIWFAFVPDRQSTIIGPVALNQVNYADGARIPLPALMEFGGEATIREEQRIRTSNPGKWFRRDLRRSVNEDKRYRTRRAQYAARPFMGPALQKEIEAGTIIDAFAGVVVPN
jgi:hypothetical protein